MGVFLQEGGYRSLRKCFCLFVFSPNNEKQAREKKVGNENW